MKTCPFDGPPESQPDISEPCPVCGDLGTLEAMDKPSRCISTSTGIAELDDEARMLARKNKLLEAERNHLREAVETAIAQTNGFDDLKPLRAHLRKVLNERKAE